MLMMIKDPVLHDTVRSLFQKYNLPTSYSYDVDTLYNYIKLDKKITGKTINLILLKEEGNAFIKTISISKIKEYM
jgi:3-dehydroquinate synthetase